jgi:hypothetical protein
MDAAPPRGLWPLGCRGGARIPAFGGGEGGATGATGELPAAGKGRDAALAAQPAPGSSADAADVEAGEASCAFCLEGFSGDVPALRSPCRCRGSLALVHAKCLQRDLQARAAAACAAASAPIADSRA